MDLRAVFLHIRQNVLGALQEVVTQEEATQRMLHPPTHLHQVLQDVLARQLVGFDVHCAHCDQQIPTNTTHTNA